MPQDGRLDGRSFSDQMMEDKILSSVSTRQLFDRSQCRVIEKKIDEIVLKGKQGLYKKQTVDRAPLRTKYFFGEGYTYGGQLKTRGPGNERLYPQGEVDPIPDWIHQLVIQPIEESGMIPKDWVNSAVVNDYLPGGCIVSHIDPPQLFDRPIITASFLSHSSLSFGCKFSFKPISVSQPLARVPVSRGCVLSMAGFSADEVTHCIRPEDITERRAVVILRHVPHSAPRMDYRELEELKRMEEQKNNYWKKDKRHERQRSRSPHRRSRNKTSESWPRKRRCSRSWSREKRRLNSPRKSRSPRRRSDKVDKRLRSFYSDTSSTSSRSNSPDISSRHHKVKLCGMKPSVPGFVYKRQGEMSNDEKIMKTVSQITENLEMDHEELAFQKRLEKLKGKISNELEIAKQKEMSLKQDFKDAQNDFHDSDNISENKKECGENIGLKHEVNELKEELRELKESMKDLKSKPEKHDKKETSDSDSFDKSDDEEDSKTINAVDIISREVRTTILSKTKTKSKATYLIIKAEKKKKLLKSKLIELKNEKKKIAEKDQTSYVTEFKQKVKKQKFRTNQDMSTGSDSDDVDIEGKSLMEAIKRRLEKKIKKDYKKFGKESKNKAKKDFSRRITPGVSRHERSGGDYRSKKEEGGKADQGRLVGGQERKGREEKGKQKQSLAETIRKIVP